MPTSYTPSYSYIQSSPVKVLAVIHSGKAVPTSYTPSYSYIQSSPVKVLAVIYRGKKTST